MASSSKGAELGTQIEFTRPQKLPEQKREKPDSLSISGALGALNQDNPKVKNRTDLANLANAGQRKKYRRFDTMAQYREAKKSADVSSSRHRIEPNAQKSAEIDESKRIYEEPDLDPIIRQTNDKISSKTNLAPDVQAAFTSNDPLTINQTWFNARNRISAQTWSEFVNKYPDKAAAYAEKHQGIRAALAEIKRQEQAQQQVQTSARVQAENNQLLADSVRRETNDVSENMASEELAASESEIKGAEGSEITETGSETKLLSMETTGVQATLLLGGEISAEIDRAKIEAIAAGGPINSENANKASLGERQEYWNGKNSPFKGMTFGQQMEKWQEGTKRFLDQYKGKPEAEFFKRVGIDLESENVVREIYNTYFADGKGDVGLFASKIAANNSTEQVQANMDVIQKFGKMYGENSAKVAGQLVIGIKNAQIDMDLFVKSAQADLEKGEGMPGLELITVLSEKINQSKENQLDVGERQSETGASVDSGSTKQEHKLNWNERTPTDKWTAGSGDLKIDGDFLAHTPHTVRQRNPYTLGTTEYDYFEKYQVKYFKPDKPSDYFIGEQRRRVERGIELAVDSESAGESKKIPTPMFWEIIEADPESVSGEQFDRYITLDQEDNSVKSVNPVDLKIRNTDGTTQDVDVNFSWGKLQVDKQTLIAMQQKAIEYIESQVAAGTMDSDMLAAAKGLLDSHKVPDVFKQLESQDKEERNKPESPRLHNTFFQLNEHWSNKGTLTQEENNLVYKDEKLSKNRQQRSVEISTVDPDNPDSAKKVLTRQAWKILTTVPDNIPDKRGGNFFVPALLDGTSLTNVIQDRKGVWKRFVKPFTAFAPTLSKMQGMIRNYVENQVAEGNMDKSVLAAIDGLRKYKLAALEPVKYDVAKYRAKLDFRRNAENTQRAAA